MRHLQCLHRGTKFLMNHLLWSEPGNGLSRENDELAPGEARF
jgi:hypothetical protein